METMYLCLAILAGLGGVAYGFVGIRCPEIAFYWFGRGWKYQNLTPSPHDLWAARAGAISGAVALGVGTCIFLILLTSMKPGTALLFVGVAVFLVWLVGNQAAAVIWPERYFYWKNSQWEEEHELKPSPLHLFVIRARAGLLLTCMAGAILYLALQLDSEKTAAVPASQEHEEVAL